MKQSQESTGSELPVYPFLKEVMQFGMPGGVALNMLKKGLESDVHRELILQTIIGRIYAQQDGRGLALVLSATLGLREEVNIHVGASYWYQDVRVVVLDVNPFADANENVQVQKVNGELSWVASAELMES